jgi:hypothetical protein
VVVFNTILDWDNVHVSPVEGDTLSVRLTVPVRPSRPTTVMIEVPAVPANMVTEGTGVIAKS